MINYTYYNMGTGKIRMKNNKAYVKKIPLKKLNQLIASKYEASQIELKTTFLALYKLQNGEYQKKEDGYYVTIKAAELKKEMKTESNNVYKKLKGVAKKMTARSIGMVDDEKKRFSYVSFITMADYDNCVFTLRFPNEMKNFLIDVRKNFTSLDKEIYMSLNGAYSCKLYELLRSQCFYPEEYKGLRNNMFYFEISVAELKFALGILDVNDSKVQNILENSKGNSLDFERAAKIIDKTNYKRWWDFSNRIIIPSLEEINSKTDIKVEYNTIQSSREGIDRISFIIELVKIEDVVIKEIPEIEKNDFYNDVEKIFGEFNFSLNDIIKISEEAEYNIDVLKEQKKCIENYDKHIDNLVKFIINGIKKYRNKPEKQNKKREVVINTHGEDDANEIKAYNRTAISEIEENWIKYKNDKMFPEFIDYIGLEIKDFEKMFSVEERIEKFGKWKIKMLDL